MLIHSKPFQTEQALSDSNFHGHHPALPPPPPPCIAALRSHRSCCSSPFDFCCPFSLIPSPLGIVWSASRRRHLLCTATAAALHRLVGFILVALHHRSEAPSASTPDRQYFTTSGQQMAQEPHITIVLEQNQLKNVYDTTWLAYYDIKKPSSLPNSVLALDKKLPKVCLDLVRPIDIPRLSAMQGINHKNIMRIEAVKEVETEDPNENLLALFLDHHNGPLGVHLDSFQLYDNYRVLPSQSFRDIIRQIICGLEELWKNGFYHGDLTMNNILVSKRAQVLIKLYNFRTRDIPKEDAQLEDCVAVGSLLQHISNELKSLNPHLIYSLIDELASTLTGLTNIASLQTVEEMMCKQLFFWEPRRRMIFWIHDVPKALENAGCDRIIRAHNWKLPWDSRTHPGLLKAMNDYRFEEERRKSGNSAQVTPENTKYNANDSLHYVKCISGAYTHEDQLQGKILNNFGYKLSVDAAVCSKDPELFIVVFKILKDQGMILD